MKKNPPGATAPRSLRGLYAAIIIIVVAAAAYHGIMNIFFIGPDFKYLIYGKNADLATLMRHFIPHRGDTGYRYLTLWIWKLDYLLWGLEPKGYLIQTFLVHCANAFLVYLVCRSVNGRWFQALTAGLVFALFPPNTEVVCWAPANFYTFSTLFYLASLLAYIKWRTVAGAFRYYLPSLIFEVLALLTYGATVTLPLMIWIFDFIFLSGEERGSFIARNARRMKRCSLHFLILMAYLGFRYGFDLGIGYPEESMIRALPTTLRLVFVDIPLTFSIPLKPTALWPDGINIFLVPLPAKLCVLGALLALGIFIFKVNRPLPWRHIGAGALWVAVCVLPFWNVLWMLEWDLFTIRHYYLASAGWALILAAFVAGREASKKILTLCIGSVFILFYFLLTISYVTDWERSSSICREVTTQLKQKATAADGTRIYLMNIPWLHNGVLCLWNPIDIMMSLSPDTPYTVQRETGMCSPRSDGLIWKAFPFKVFILNRSPILTFSRNQDERPPMLTPETLRDLEYGSNDFFFYWDSEDNNLKNVTREIEKMARDGTPSEPFATYFKSTIWVRPPEASGREEWLAI